MRHDTNSPQQINKYPTRSGIRFVHTFVYKRVTQTDLTVIKKIVCFAPRTVCKFKEHQNIDPPTRRWCWITFIVSDFNISCNGACKILICLGDCKNNCRNDSINYAGITTKCKKHKTEEKCSSDSGELRPVVINSYPIFHIKKENRKFSQFWSENKYIFTLKESTRHTSCVCAYAMEVRVIYIFW